MTVKLTRRECFSYERELKWLRAELDKALSKLAIQDNDLGFARAELASKGEAHKAALQLATDRMDTIVKLEEIVELATRFLELRSQENGDALRDALVALKK
jgi:hypothetical protein